METKITLILLAVNWALSAQVITSRNVTLSFFSSAPIEDIEAKSTDGVSAINLTSRSIYFKVPIRSFQFKKSLMQEHFNENYMESDKYPFAEFNGVINESVDFSKDGSYPVTAQGDLKIHGVSKHYTVNAKLFIAQGKITADSSFPVRLENHNVKIPRLVIKNIAEVVQVTVSVVYNSKDGPL